MKGRYVQQDNGRVLSACLAVSKAAPDICSSYNCTVPQLDGLTCHQLPVSACSLASSGRYVRQAGLRAAAGSSTVPGRQLAAVQREYHSRFKAVPPDVAVVRFWNHRLLLLSQEELFRSVIDEVHIQHESLTKVYK
jgi:hypothetical protein